MINVNIKLLILFILAIQLSGCLYGQCMNGPCALEHSRIIKSITPYLQKWEKAGVSPEARGEDSVDCGGNTSSMSNHKEKSLQLPDETIWEARSRLANQWRQCMLDKGYLYTGKCYDTKRTKDDPACKGRILEPLK